MVSSLEASSPWQLKSSYAYMYFSAGRDPLQGSQNEDGRRLRLGGGRGLNCYSGCGG